MIRKLLVALIWKNPLSPYGSPPLLATGGSIRWWLFALVVLFTLYAPVELTRVNLLANKTIGNLVPDQLDTLALSTTEHTFEIAFIWIIYLAGMFLAWRLIKKGKTEND